MNPIEWLSYFWPMIFFGSVISVLVALWLKMESEIPKSEAVT